MHRVLSAIPVHLLRGNICGVNISSTRRSSERPGYRAGFQLRCKRILIHLVFGELGQHSISLLFLFEALMQKSLVIAQV